MPSDIWHMYLFPISLWEWIIWQKQQKLALNTFVAPYFLDFWCYPIAFFFLDLDSRSFIAIQVVIKFCFIDIHRLISWLKYLEENANEISRYTISCYCFWQEKLIRGSKKWRGNVNIILKNFWPILNPFNFQYDWNWQFQ